MADDSSVRKKKDRKRDKKERKEKKKEKKGKDRGKPEEDLVQLEEGETTEGSGTFYYSDDVKYEQDDPVGEWKRREEDGKIVRQGKGRFEDGKNVYEGSFVNDTMNGWGVFSYSSGARYEGDWVNGKYHGHGTYVWGDGRRYEGEWVENRYVVKRKDGSKKKEMPRMHGSGVFVDAEGEQWTGTFYNNAGPGLKNALL